MWKDGNIICVSFKDVESFLSRRNNMRALGMVPENRNEIVGSVTPAEPTIEAAIKIGKSQGRIFVSRGATGVLHPKLPENL